MTDTLHRVSALSDNPDFVSAFAKSASEQTVCTLCGLQRMGHAPETNWLGFEPHAFDPRPANSVDMARARELTFHAYQNRN